MRSILLHEEFNTALAGLIAGLLLGVLFTFLALVFCFGMMMGCWFVLIFID